MDATVDQLINAVRQHVVLPRVFAAKLPLVGAQVTKLSLYPTGSPDYAAKAGLSARDGQRQIERVSQLRCHATSVTEGEG